MPDGPESRPGPDGHGRPGPPPGRPAAPTVIDPLVPAEECLRALNPGPVRMGMDDPARRPVGQLRTRLEYADPALLPDELPELLGQLQQACVEACDAITKRYFQYEAPVLWERDG